MDKHDSPSLSVVPTQGPGEIASPVGLDHVRQYIRASKAENTLRGYRADWRDFCAWPMLRSTPRYRPLLTLWRPISQNVPGDSSLVASSGG